jgi:DNA-directed RNA polymerase subunit RPC12/RpoP
MVKDVPFSARCTRCGNQSLARPDRLALEARMECQICGYSATVVEFADIAVLEAMLRQMSDAAGFVH